jgi:hypothetical protein
MLLLGGFGLPGGAVFIQTSSIRSRAWLVAVSLAGDHLIEIFFALFCIYEQYSAGPFANFCIGLLFSAPFWFISRFYLFKPVLSTFISTLT